MTTLTFADLRHPSFYQAMTKLAHCEKFRNPSVIMSISKIYIECFAAWKASDKIHQALIEKYGLRDEAGQLVQVEGQSRIELIPETAEEYAFKDSEMRATTVEFTSPKFDLEDLLPAELSPIQVHYLMPFINEPG